MKKILIADEKTARAAFIAAAFGPDAVAAHTAPQAMELIRLHAPRVILISVTLAGMDGFELYEWLRLHPDTASARVWFILDRYDEQTASSCSRLGAEGVLYGASDQLAAQLSRYGLTGR